jgi:predicted RNase H-like nuclease
MSERMTEAALFVELDRARRVEAEQAEELTRKDEVIRELAEVLEEVGEAIVSGTLNSDDDGAPEVIRRALQKAGRL